MMEELVVFAKSGGETIGVIADVTKWLKLVENNGLDLWLKERSVTVTGMILTFPDEQTVEQFVMKFC